MKIVQELIADGWLGKTEYAAIGFWLNFKRSWKKQDRGIEQWQREPLSGTNRT